MSDGPTLRGPDDRRCPGAVRHQWEREPSRDLDLGDAYRCAHCRVVRWNEAADTTTVARVAAHSVDEPTAHRLVELSFADNGLMARTFLACRRRTSTFTGSCFIASDRGVIVGWGLRWRCDARARWSLHVFVDPRHRRSGIGAQIVEEARKGLRRSLIAHPSTDDAYRFFQRWAGDPGITIRDHRAIKDAS